LDEVRAAGLDESSAKVYDFENLEGSPAIIRAKGLDRISPVDGRKGASYVHCLLEDDDNNEGCDDEHTDEEQDCVGPVQFMLSYSWGYSIGDICHTLDAFCQSHNQDPKRTYVWICCLCVNQHRVVEHKLAGGNGLLNFERDFPLQLSRIGYMLTMMAPWNKPLHAVYKVNLVHF
jgi:hypothetical protein